MSMPWRELYHEVCVQLIEADKEIAKLKESLKIFGEHPHSCKYWQSNATAPCSCGLKELTS